MNRTCLLASLSLLLAASLPLRARAAEPEDFILPPPPPEVGGDAAPRSLLLGARFGATLPEAFNRLRASFLAELEAAYQLPVLDKRLGVFFDVGYTQPTRTGTAADPRVPSGSVTYDETIRDIGFTLGLHFRQPLTSAVALYGGMGARLHITHTLIDASSAGTPYGENTESSTRVGARVRLGGAYKLGPGSIVLEGHFDWVGIDHLITGGERAGESANTSDLAFQVGYQLFVL